MKKRLWMVSVLLIPALTAMGAANGKWLKKVPDADRKRVNPYAGQPEAAAAGKILFRDNCAKCHGADANGQHGRPSLRSERIQNATDGEIAWILKNGDPWKGMPSWSSLPEQQRWQLVTYIRSLPLAVSAPTKTGSQPEKGEKQ
ncbi:MAG TPA: c-type cytochrome [Acidobacteriaceae bacterium]|jgi:mono/diheme cytochrome c family protein|nr:c-type cytochrome [Acidobacteriaceae bacterium]